jgi:hypothetical protein
MDQAVLGMAKLAIVEVSVTREKGWEAQRMKEGNNSFVLRPITS